MATGIQPRNRSIGDALLIAVFLAAIGAPWLASWRVAYQVARQQLTPPAGPPAGARFSLPENAPVVEVPLCAAKKAGPGAEEREGLKNVCRIGRCIGATLRTDYGGKALLVKAGAWVRYFGWQRSSVESVLVGRDGWLYYYAPESRACMQNVEIKSPARVQAWSEMLRREAVAAHAAGAKYLLVPCPNKHTIYPEFLPPYVQPAEGPTIIDELIGRLQDTPEVEVLDVRPVLLEKRKQIRVYHKTDSHWNEVGAYEAAKAILERLAEWYPSIRSSDYRRYHLERRIGTGGDLAYMMRLWDVIQEEYLMMRPDRETTTDWFATSNINCDVQAREQFKTCSPTGEIPRVVVFRDSFSTALIPYLGPHFCEAHWIWKPGFDRSLVEELRPNVVIRIIVERTFAGDPGMLAH